MSYHSVAWLVGWW